MPGPNARPPVSFRSLILHQRAVQRDGRVVLVRFCGPRTGAGVWLQLADEHSAAETARRIYVHLHQATGDDDYNLRVQMIGHAAEQEAAELNLQQVDGTAAVAETRDEQKKNTETTAQIVREVKADLQEKGVLEYEPTADEPKTE